MIDDAVASTYDLSPQRMHCSFLSLTRKRVITNGQALVAIDQAPSVLSSPSSSGGGIPIWAIVVAVIGGLCLLIAIIILIVVVVRSNSRREDAWEKY